MTANAETLAHFIDAVWNRGELDAIDRFVADTFTVAHDPGDPWDHQTLSPAELKDRVEQSRAPFPDQVFTVVHTVTEGDTVCIAWTWHATHVLEAAGFEPTGRTITMSGATLYFFEQGRITGHWQIADRLSVYQQLMANQAEG